MFAKIRSHGPVLSVAAAALTVGLIAPATGHGVQHALFAHNAGKLDGLDSLAFARSSKVMTTHGGNSWQPYGTTVPGLNRYISAVAFTAGGSMVLPLDAPSYLNKKSLGLAKIDFCYSTTDTAIISGLQIYASEAVDAPLVFSDATDRSSLTIRCDSIVVNAAPHKGMGLWATTGGTGTVRLEGVRATWTAAALNARQPVGRAPARANG